MLYIVRILIVDRKRLKDLLFFGSLIAVAAGFIDIVAVSLGLWEYKFRILPYNPATFPFDYSVVPILYIIVMQYTSSWRSYLIGSVLAAAFFSFIIPPVYVLVGIKEYYGFNYFYMFLLVFLVTTIIRFIYNWIDSINIKARKTDNR